MKKAILIVSFGTTYPDTRQKNIAAITRQVRALYPDAVVEEAVSSTIVRNAMKKREHIEAKSPTEALESMKKQGVPHVRFHAPSKSMGNLPPLPSATPTVLLPHPHNPAVLPKAHRQLQSVRKHLPSE